MINKYECTLVSNFLDLVFVKDLYVHEKNKFTDLNMIKSESKYTIYPQINTTSKCTMMLLSNLAEPEWIFIHCVQHLLPIVACTKGITNPTIMKTNFQIIANEYLCDHFHIRINDTCYFFTWSSYNVTHSSHLGISSLSTKTNIIEAVKIFVNSIHMDGKTLLSISLRSFKGMHILKFWRHLNELKYQHHIVTSWKHEGYSVYISEKIQLNLRRLLFQCLNGTYILHEYVCDGIVDCIRDYSDEHMCICNDTIYTENCKEIFINEQKILCFHTSHITITGLCNKFNYWTNTHASVIKNDTQKYLNMYFCKSGNSIDKYLVNDLVSDCGIEGDDEALLHQVLNNGVVFSCDNPAELPCKYGHPRCFNLTDVCNFKLFQNKYLMPCRNGAHLQRCQKFDCNIKFKCQNNYCIPWIYVCDGKWDCPEGDDEQEPTLCGTDVICQQMYKCRKTQRRCIHLGVICDGHNDCPHKDDELNCELKEANCLSSCQCLLFAIYCDKVAKFMFTHIPYYISVYISNSLIPYVKYLSKILQFARIIHLPGNSIKMVCDQVISKQCLLLDLRINSIQFLFQNCFSLLESLRSLSLCTNKIRFIHSHSFYNLSRLDFLNLSYNPILNLPSFFMTSQRNGIVLSVTEINLAKIETKAFHGSDITVIISQDYHVCCIVTVTYFCSAHQPWYVTCKEIFTNTYTGYFYILIPALIILSNVISLILIISSKRTFSVIVSFINITHLTGQYFAQTQIRELRVETETETESACEPNNKTNSHTQTKISYFNK